MQTSRAVAREAGLVALATACLILLASPGDVALAQLHPHPAWLAVLLLATRYGSRGLSIALPTVFGALIGASICVGAPLATLANRMLSTPDLIALAASVVVAWVASIHEQRALELAGKVESLSGRAAQAEQAASELYQAALALRGRSDRIETSLSFLRDIAERMEWGDESAGAHAALELAMARTGARVGVVQVFYSGRLRTVAQTGTWSADALTPPDLYRDRTANAALQRQTPLRALDLSFAGDEDSDMAAPITDEAGQEYGVIALRGVPYAHLGAGQLSDLTLIARWCAKSFAQRPIFGADGRIAQRSND
jgi:hypothetical protein